MAGKYWIKLYIEILDDPKMAQLSPWIWRRAIELFLIAGKENKAGLLPPVEDMLWILRSDKKKFIESLQMLAEIGVVHETEPGSQRWVVTHFATRQDADSTSERVKHHRDEKHKKLYYGDNPDGNGTCNETLQSRYTDVEKKREEVDVDDNRPVISPLSVAFVNATNIPELTGGVVKWTDALKKMQNAHVEPQDIEQAVKEMRDKGYQITGPWSVVNPAITCMSRRTKGSGSKPTGRLLIGANGEERLV